MFKWKINMSDGNSYLVKSNIANANKFMNMVFGIKEDSAPNVNISHFESAFEKNNWIAIVSTHVVSVEYRGKQ